MAQLTLIAAVARNGVIGRDNALPWHLPEDLQHFKRHTLGRPIVMGRKTWESIGRPLPKRRNIVVSRQAHWQAEGAEVAASLDEALARCAEAEVVCIIGGTALFEAALPKAEVLMLTEIDADFEGEARFPEWPRAAFTEVSRERHQSDQGWSYDFVCYRRKAA